MKQLAFKSRPTSNQYADVIHRSRIRILWFFKYFFNSWILLTFKNAHWIIRCRPICVFDWKITITLLHSHKNTQQWQVRLEQGFSQNQQQPIRQKTQFTQQAYTWQSLPLWVKRHCATSENLPTQIHLNNMVLNFYRAMLCIRGMGLLAMTLCLSFRPSQVGVLQRRLNESSWFLARELPSTRPRLC